MENVLAERAPVRLRRPARLLRLASDERLVAFVRGGDEGAFEALYDRHHPAILGFCRHMLGTREEAEDAVQHTFLAAFRDLAVSEKPIDLRPWLFAIARNRCLSLLRARRAHVAIELAEPSTDGLAATVERREDLRELLADLACLPEDQRAALLLAELGALDHIGIAAVLGCPREKVKALVFQARTSLAASREARATPCEDIRVELATASGAALRRGPLRRHLRTCGGCRAFKAEVATQRKLLALALPVVPGVALKASVLAGGGAAAGSGAAAGGGATATAASSGSLGSLLGTVSSTGAGKAAMSLAVAGVVAGGGAFTTVELEHRDRAPAPSVQSHRAAADARPVAPIVGLDPAGGDVSRPAPARRRRPALVHRVDTHPAGRSGVVPSHVPAAAGGSELTPEPAPAQPVHISEVSPAPAASADPAPPFASTTDPAPAPAPTPRTGGDGHHETPPPAHETAPPGDKSGSTPRNDPSPGDTHRHESDGEGTPSRGQAGDSHGQAGEPHGQAGEPHGQAGEPHGQAGEPHGQAGEPHGQAGEPHGQAGEPHGQAGEPHGQAGEPHGQAGEPHGQAGDAHAQDDVSNGQADASHGKADTAPGQADVSHGRAGSAHGHD